MVRKFEFKKSYEEIEIAGKIYRFKTDDQSLFNYRDQLMKHGNEMIELSKKNDISEEEMLKLCKQKFTDVLKVIFEVDCFEELYEAAGGSMFNMTDLISFISDVVKEKVDELKQKGQQVPANRPARRGKKKPRK